MNFRVERPVLIVGSKLQVTFPFDFHSSGPSSFTSVLDVLVILGASFLELENDNVLKTLSNRGRIKNCYFVMNLLRKSSHHTGDATFSGLGNRA